MTTLGAYPVTYAVLLAQADGVAIPEMLGETELLVTVFNRLTFPPTIEAAAGVAEVGKITTT